MADRDRLFDYVAARSVRMTATLDERIAEITSTLELFPQAAERWRIPGSRKFVIKDTPYVAYYTVLLDHVRILRVLHQSQRPPKRL